MSKSLLERTFPTVYGLELKDVLPNDDLAISSYRFSVSTLVPKMTKVALQSHKKELIQGDRELRQSKSSCIDFGRADYEKEWGKGVTENLDSAL